MEGAVPSGEPVCIEYSHLIDQAHDLSTDLLRAFGRDGLGLILIRGVPGFRAARQRLLPLARRLSELPPAELARLEDAASRYNIGWSHGREALRDGKPDTHKGSFYANPMLDSVTEDTQLQAEFPAYARPNIWPTQALPELEPAFKECGRIIVAAGLHLACRCDTLLAARQREAGGEAGTGTVCPSLHDTLQTSPCHKARLLHYYAAPGGAASDSWCAWHTDHGSLTGLCAAQYLDAGGAAVAGGGGGGVGLHIRTLHGQVVRVGIPPECLAFQLGEAAQVLSGGLFTATLHCVVGPEPGSGGSQLTRETFAVFMQPR
ncbi:hypothetical protein ACKKBG_A06380 [Auxenochlorella protothecoides x Auxenochlorella symbiontica]